jgi:hypothetical protein
VCAAIRDALRRQREVLERRRAHAARRRRRRARRRRLAQGRGVRQDRGLPGLREPHHAGRVLRGPGPCRMLDRSVRLRGRVSPSWICPW